MDDKKISALSTYTNPDAVNDYIPIVASGTNYRINRNSYLGITSAPVGLTDVQVITNKTLTAPTISSPVFSGTITGTYTIGGTPTFPSSVVTLTGPQTLTNKILTSPTLTSPTLTNASITQDAVVGFTTANSGTVYGVVITAGLLGANTVTTTSITNASVTPPKLADMDWFKTIPGGVFSSTIAGTWIQVPSNTSSGSQGWNAGQSAGAINEEVQYKCVLQAGTYTIRVHADKDINRGIITLSVDGASQGTFDCYNASRQANAIGTITTAYVLATSKLVTVNVKAATKNASSSAYFLNINEIDFVRTA